MIDSISLHCLLSFLVIQRITGQTIDQITVRESKSVRLQCQGPKGTTSCQWKAVFDTDRSKEIEIIHSEDPEKSEFDLGFGATGSLQYHKERRVCDLVIRNISRHIAKNYMCLSKTKELAVSQLKLFSINVQVLVAPSHPYITWNDVKLKEGHMIIFNESVVSDLTLKCITEKGFPAAFISWHRYNGGIQTTNVKRESYKDYPDLVTTIHEVAVRVFKPDHPLLRYVNCSAYHPEYPKAYSTGVIVGIAHPTSKVHLLGGKISRKGIYLLSLRCTSDGLPIPQYVLLRMDRNSTNDGSFEPIETNDDGFFKINANEKGTYSCKAKNSLNDEWIDSIDIIDNYD